MTWAISIVDYDRNGDVDIFTADDIGLPHIFQNDGTGHFVDVVEEAGVAIIGSWIGLAFAGFTATAT